MKISSREADKLFERLNAADPVAVISELKPIVRFQKKNRNEVIFEYDSDHNHMWYLMGLAYESLGELKEAAHCFSIAIEIYPSDADAYVAYSNTEDDLNKQILSLERGLKNIEDPRMRLNLANALLDLNEPRKALFHLEKVTPEFLNYSNVIESRKVANSILDTTSKN